MNWKVLVRAENPPPGTLATLEELTGLSRGEVLLALRRTGLTVGDDFDEPRARALARTLGDLGLSCTVSQAAFPETPAFRVVLTGFKPGHRARLRETLQRLSGLPQEQIVVWLSRIPFVLKDSVDYETARRIKRALVEAGGMVDLRPVQPAATAQAEPKAAPVEAPKSVRAASPPLSGAETVAGPFPVSPSGKPEEGGQACALSDPPQTAAFRAPPVIPGGPMTSEAPPVIIFRWPGRAPVEPPVLPSLEDLGRIPPSSCETPPMLHPVPSPPGSALSVYLHSISQDAVEGLLGTLCEGLEFGREEAMAILDRRLPTRIVSGQSHEKAREIAALLERPGVTVGLSSTVPYRSAPASNQGGFIAWLKRNG